MQWPPWIAANRIDGLRKASRERRAQRGIEHGICKQGSKPVKAARNAAVKFDAASKGKVTQKRANEPRRSSKRNRRRKRRREKRQEHCTDESDSGKSRKRPKPGKAARNAAVKFDAASKGKVTQKRANDTRRSSKRSRI